MSRIKVSHQNILPKSTSGQNLGVRRFHGVSLADADASLRYLEYLVVNVADGHGVAAEIHHEVAVAENADYVAFLACHNACQDAEFDVVFGELDEGVAEERDAVGLRRHQLHEGLHHSVGDDGGKASGAVVYEIIVWKILYEKGFQLFRGALKKDEAADGGLFFLHYALAVGLFANVYGAMYETAWTKIAVFEVQTLYFSVETLCYIVT